MSKSVDTVGAMARSARDVAAASEILLDSEARSRLPEGGYTSFFTGSFRGLKIGFVNPAIWRFPPDLWVPSEEAKSQHVSGPTAVETEITLIFGKDTAYHRVRKEIHSRGANVT